MHIQRDAFNIDNIEEKLEQLKVDVMRTECPIVIAGTCKKRSNYY